MKAKAIVDLPEIEFRNNDERRYAADVLEPLKEKGAIVDWRYEQVRFQLAKGTAYTPDFMIIWEDGVVEFVEYKGWRRPTGIVKIKVAAEKFPWFNWKLVEKRLVRDGGGYKETSYP